MSEKPVPSLVESTLLRKVLVANKFNRKEMSRKRHIGSKNDMPTARLRADEDDSNFPPVLDDISLSSSSAVVDLTGDDEQLKLASCATCYECVRSMLKCNCGYAVCRDCFSKYILLTWGDRQVSPGTVPQVACVGESCKNIHDSQQVARYASSEAWRFYTTRQEEARKAVTLGEVAEMLKTTSSSSTTERDVQRNQDILLAEQLKLQMKSAKMCPRCYYGPIDVKGCDDLRAHHAEKKGTGSIDNSCPHCKFFAVDTRGWVQWDGVIRRDLPKMVGSFGRNEPMTHDRDTYRDASRVHVRRLVEEREASREATRERVRRMMEARRAGSSASSGLAPPSTPSHPFRAPETLVDPSGAFPNFSFPFSPSPLLLNSFQRDAGLSRPRGMSMPWAEREPLFTVPRAAQSPLPSNVTREPLQPETDLFEPFLWDFDLI